MNMFKSFPAQSRTCDECLSHYETSITDGLTESEANRRLDVVGFRTGEREADTYVEARSGTVR